MCSLNQSSSSEWSRLHDLSKIAGKYAFADNSYFLSEVLGNEAILEVQYCAPQ